MKRLILAALALVFVMGLQPQAARAQSNTQPNNANVWTWLWGNQDPRLTGVGIGLGAAATAVSFAATAHHHARFGNGVFISAWAATAAGCAAVYPIVGTIVVNRPLTPREAYVGIANCFVPIVGGWLVDAWLPHDAWTDGLPPPKKARHHHG